MCILILFIDVGWVLQLPGHIHWNLIIVGITVRMQTLQHVFFANIQSGNDNFDIQTPCPIPQISSSTSRYHRCTTPNSVSVPLFHHIYRKITWSTNVTNLLNIKSTYVDSISRTYPCKSQVRPTPKVNDLKLLSFTPAIHVFASTAMREFPLIWLSSTWQLQLLHEAMPGSHTEQVTCSIVSCEISVSLWSQHCYSCRIAVGLRLVLWGCECFSSKVMVL